MPLTCIIKCISSPIYKRDISKNMAIYIYIYTPPLGEKKFGLNFKQGRACMRFRSAYFYMEALDNKQASTCTLWYLQRLRSLMPTLI